MSDNLETIQEIFGRKWARYILRVLYENPLGYTEIQHCVILYADHTVHSRTLTETLRWLEGQHYVAVTTENAISTLAGIPVVALAFAASHSRFGGIPGREIS